MREDRLQSLQCQEHEAIQGGRMGSDHQAQGHLPLLSVTKNRAGTCAQLQLSEGPALLRLRDKKKSATKWNSIATTAGWHLQCIQSNTSSSTIFIWVGTTSEYLAKCEFVRSLIARLEW